MGKGGPVKPDRLFLYGECVSWGMRNQASLRMARTTAKVDSLTSSLVKDSYASTGGFLVANIKIRQKIREIPAVTKKVGIPNTLILPAVMIR